ncbi:copper resistance protein CopD [Halobacteria archaeon AArc-dxtr1]|nr:copper resistance protein CopD [Halobacteria archaeon AArc-dxtr1]
MADYLVATTVHLVFAALWVGSVFYAAFVLVPLARDGAFSATAPLSVAAGRLAHISRASALVLLLSGGHMAGAAYTADSLFGSTRGQLVLAMVALWFLMMVLVEIGVARFRSGLDEQKLREPARNAQPVLRAAALTGVLLMIVAGMLSANVTQVL